LLLVFFMNQFPPPPQSIPIRPFRILSKIRGDIREARCTTGINDTGGKFATGVNDTGGKIAAGINDTGGKFATGISDTGGKFATGINDAGGKLPPVSTTPVANHSNNIRLQTP
jgi:hypothetical protein